MKRLCRQCLLLALGALAAVATPAAIEAAEEETRLEVVSASARLEEGVWLVDADLRIDLRDPLHEALHSGVALTFVVEFEVVRPRNWWFDETLAHVEQRWRISFHALSRQYLLLNLNTRKVSTFYGLKALLAHLGHVRGFPLVDDRLLPRDVPLEAAIRMRLDTEALPLPLRLRALTGSRWDPASDWYRWPLR